MPEHLRAYIEAFAAAHPKPAPLPDHGLAAGDVRMVRFDSGPCMPETSALVVIDRVLVEYVVAWLCHPFVEMQTASDRRCRPEGLAYDLVVMEDLPCTVDKGALGRLLGRDHGDGFYGMSLMGSLDARWEFKHRQGHVASHASRSTLLRVLEWYPACECTPIEDEEDDR